MKVSLGIIALRVWMHWACLRYIYNTAVTGWSFLTWRYSYGNIIAKNIVNFLVLRAARYNCIVRKSAKSGAKFFLKSNLYLEYSTSLPPTLDHETSIRTKHLFIENMPPNANFSEYLNDKNLEENHKEYRQHEPILI